MDSLESPGSDATPNWEALYRYRGEDVTVTRPTFTGDVFRDEATGKMILVAQHPCAIRKNGVDLVDSLLVLPVVARSQAFKTSDWRRFYRLMPLPDLLDTNGDHYAAQFDQPEVVSGITLADLSRVACLSLRGVNLLLQRWVHHNSRVIVETHAINNATIEQFEEADLVEEWCEEWLIEGRDANEAEAQAHAWLRSDSGDGRVWQELLKDSQSRGEVRAAMRAHLKTTLS